MLAQHTDEIFTSSASSPSGWPNCANRACSEHRRPHPPRTRRGGRDVLVDRAEARNALTTSMREQMRAYFDELASDRDVRVVFLRGAGGTFISGADIKGFSSSARQTH
jgi:Enoyl-CoA hydratase/carnithine racemase